MFPISAFVPYPETSFSISGTVFSNLKIICLSGPKFAQSFFSKIKNVFLRNN